MNVAVPPNGDSHARRYEGLSAEQSLSSSVDAPRRHDEGAIPSLDVTDARDPELYALVERTLRQAADLLRRATDERGWHSRYSRFPVLTQPFQSGLPHITFDVSPTVAHYTDVIGVKQGQFTLLGYDDIPSFAELFEYVSNHERLAEYALDFAKITVALVFFGLLERVLHLHGFDFTDSQLRDSYLEIEAGLLDENLPLEIVVPIALTPFGFDDAVEIADNLLIERMDEEWQLARMPESQVGIGEAANSMVISAATHAFVFRGYTMPNSNRYISRADRLGFYPVEQINRAFAALRIATGIRTGYAQVSIRPVGWAFDWKAHLPPVGGGTLVRRYPPSFDDWGWIEAPPGPISIEKAQEVGELDSLLDSAPSNVQLASRRYLGAGLREVEEDEVVDICIGLEAALGEKSPTEITHKLALRAAAVLATEGDDPPTVFRDVRAIYRYRSAIVHGTAPEKKRLIRRKDGTEVPAAEVASEYLRRILQALLRNADWRDPSFIDDELLLGQIATNNDHA